VCVHRYINKSVCVCVRARRMRKVLDGVKRLISHYGEQWLNEAVDRREKQLEGSVCVCVRVCVCVIDIPVCRETRLQVS